MRIRYSGQDEARILACPGGGIECPRMEWVDVEAEAERLGIPVEHAQISARGVVKQDDWQLEGATKAARTRKKAAKAAAEQEPDVEPEPEVEPPADSEETPSGDDTPSGEEA